MSLICKRLRYACGAAALALAVSGADAALLYENGPIITNPTGGTGSIAGLPISNADPFQFPGNPGIFSTTGFGATFNVQTAAADDFAVPAQGWNLDTATVYSFQTGQTTPTAIGVRINLWTAPPFDANSPPPLPDPLPQPVLAVSLVAPILSTAFVCHRQSPTATGTVRPVFAYTVGLDGLPDAGELAAGNYWLEWAFVGTNNSNFFTPLVTPRTSAVNLNARLFNSPFSGTPRQWFEAREGFVDEANPGRTVALPFALNGTVLPEPAAAMLAGPMVMLRRRRERAS